MPKLKQLQNSLSGALSAFAAFIEQEYSGHALVGVGVYSIGRILIVWEILPSLPITTLVLFSFFMAGASYFLVRWAKSIDV